MIANTPQAQRAAHATPFGAEGPAVAGMRLAALERVRIAGVRHAQVVWERLRGQPVGPHGLAFLYVSAVPTGPGGHRLEVEAATRLFAGGADVEDLPRLLAELADLVRGRRVFDPRRELADRSEVRPAAMFGGVAAYSVDSADRTWAQVRAADPALVDLPGRSYLCLVDGTLILAERQDLADYQVRVRATHRLQRHLAQPSDGLRRDSMLAQDPATAPVWRALTALTEVLAERHPRPPL
ncbi:hypothetical protein [Catellatospora sp. NPDC049609]|uniref:hypothetical protein n=1 Tax=Catellatospora sp. NPDC049609 TaxID=3155505 RepID=UPI003420DFA9